VLKLTEKAPVSIIRSIIDVEKGEFVHQKPIEYIISCDFEATCDDGPVTFKCQEIIEFPVVVIDVKAKKIIGKK
jgi:hypothetical protein